MAGRDFEQLQVYKLAREFRNTLYELTRSLPADEKFNLISQIRRAALSITNNIAEGHGTYTFRHNVAYLHRARGSVYEIRDDLNVCLDLGYVQADRIGKMKETAIRLTMLIDGYVRYLRSRQPFQDKLEREESEPTM